MRLCPQCRRLWAAGKLAGVHLLECSQKLAFRCAVCGVALLGAHDLPHTHQEEHAPRPTRGVTLVVSTSASTTSTSGGWWFIPPASS
jgi:hypothetical protein